MVEGVAAAVVLRQRVEVHSSRRSRAELQPVTPREPAARMGRRQARTMVGLALKVWESLAKRVLSGPEAAMLVPALTNCSCILCSKARRQEAEGRRLI